MKDEWRYWLQSLIDFAVHGGLPAAWLALGMWVLKRLDPLGIDVGGSELGLGIIILWIAQLWAWQVPCAMVHLKFDPLPLSEGTSPFKTIAMLAGFYLYAGGVLLFLVFILVGMAACSIERLSL